jgi:hypothetical protein
MKVFNNCKEETKINQYLITKKKKRIIEHINKIKKDSQKIMKGDKIN